MRQGYAYTATKKYWTNQHLAWLQKLDSDGLHKEILEKYLLSYHTLTDRLERIDHRIEELADDARYTPKYKELYRQCKETIERVFTDAKEKHAMRDTRYRGLTQTANWVKLKFAAMNLKKLAK